MVTVMSDSTDLDGPISFVRWLFAQAKGDPTRSMPYAQIYNWGRQLNALLGLDGQFDSAFVVTELAKQGATAEDLSALVLAESAWRVDTVIDRAEAVGVPLDVGAEVATEVVSGELEPSDTVLCGYRNHRGEGCVSPAVSGSGRCGRHGGAITDPEVRRSLLLIAFTKVIDGAADAAEALLDVAVNGRSEMARVQAAKEILDRAGVQQDQHVHIHRPDEDASEDDLVDDLRRKLAISTNRLRIQAIPAESEEMYELSPVDDDIVEAVLVE